jgi:GWxTD domain-containing protein
MYKKLVIFVIMTFFGYNTLYSQNMSINFDDASFRYDNNNLLWELYYSFPDTVLTYIQTQNAWVGQLHLTAVFKSTDVVIERDDWYATNIRDNQPTGFEEMVYGTQAFVLPPGFYDVAIDVYDVNNPQKKFNFVLELNLPKITAEKIELSQLQIATFIEPVTEKSDSWSPQFIKNSLVVFPNPSAEVISENPILNLYYEIYNTNIYAPDGFKLNYTILDGAFREVFYLPLEKKNIADGLVEKIAIPIDFIPSGLYYIKASLHYPIEQPQDSAVAVKRFYVFNPNMPIQLETLFTEDQKFEKSQFASMALNEIDLEWEMAKVLAVKPEIDEWEKLVNLRAKQRFMYRFWDLRNPDKETPINERLEEFRKNIEFANVYFKYMNTPGWKTERGQILLKYGMPSERTMYNQDAETKAYEHWYYSLVEAGAHFYFVDSNGLNNYLLVHSTAIGERYNPNWYDDFVPRFRTSPRQQQNIERGY